MLRITTPAFEEWNESASEFVYTPSTTLQLEHSLVSLTKWESRWKKPFLDKGEKTAEEILDYIRCMTITQNVNPRVYNGLTEQNIAAINAYIEEPMTATTFSKTEQARNRRSGSVVTSEIIYYWMIALNIPFECQRWHLDRLLTLIRVCNIKNQPPKKMNKKSVMSRNAALNAARRQRFKSNG